MTAMQGRNEGDKGSTFPRAPNHCGGPAIVPTVSQVLSSIQYIYYRKTLGSKMGAQTCFLARVPSNLVTSLPPWSFTNPRDTVTLVFTLISYCAIVFSFILISTDNWFPYCPGQWLSVLFLFNSWSWVISYDSYETINLTKLHYAALIQANKWRCQTRPVFTAHWLCASEQEGWW